MRWVLSVILLVSFLSLLPAISAAGCTLSTTPRLFVEPLAGEIDLGEALNGTLSASNGSVIGASIVAGEGALVLEAASFSFAPNASGEARILFYAVGANGCVATRLASFEAVAPPRIDVEPDLREVSLREGERLAFSADAARILAWRLDSERFETSSASYTFMPGFNAAGSHEVEVEALDERGRSVNFTWAVTVHDVNRPPFQIEELPGFSLPVGEWIPLNLSLYFLDPDRAPMRYSAEVIGGEGVEAGRLSVEIAGSEAIVRALREGKAFITFTATDIGGATAESEPAGYVVLSSVPRVVSAFCGDGFCVGPGESCVACPRDCGACDDASCIPLWECSAWSECEPPGFQRRTCLDANRCENASERPPESYRCDYAANCNDSLRNGNETGVDCGGSCAPCPTCIDRVQNQGESGVDCGGPCDACPTCDDSTRNQAESDIDCGGPCEPCGVSRRCFRPSDCASLSCSLGMCIAATCADGTENQGESGVDCGGPCDACPTCDDAVQNQGETEVDCGGPCRRCPTCSDRTLNQDEELVDCGGPCRECTLGDRFSSMWRVGRWIVFAVLISLILALLRVIFVSRLIFLWRHGKLVHFFYEDAPTYILVKAWNSLALPFRRRHPEIPEAVAETIAELSAIKRSDRLRADVASRLRALYAEILGLPTGFEFDHLLATVKNSSYPWSVRVIILKNTKLLALLELSNLYDGPLALAEAKENLEDLRKAF